MRSGFFALLSLSAMGVAVPTLSVPAMAAGVATASDIRIADEAVVYQTHIVQQAIQTGDVATIAVERAKLQAARAAAWGKRHPAEAPARMVAVK